MKPDVLIQKMTHLEDWNTHQPYIHTETSHSYDIFTKPNDGWVKSCVKGRVDLTPSQISDIILSERASELDGNIESVKFEGDKCLFRYKGISALGIGVGPREAYVTYKKYKLKSPAGAILIVFTSLPYKSKDATVVDVNANAWFMVPTPGGKGSTIFLYSDINPYVNIPNAAAEQFIIKQNFGTMKRLNSINI